VSEHQFIVTVETDIAIPDGDEHGRTAADYAKSTLNVASLPDASRLDGFADLTGTADITNVTEL
jgi:hypothetical protein